MSAGGGTALTRRNFVKGAAAAAAAPWVPMSRQSRWTIPPVEPQDVPLYDLEVWQAADLIRRRIVSPVELAEVTLERIAQTEPRIETFVNQYAADMYKPTSQGTAAGRNRSPARIVATKPNVATTSANHCAGPLRAVSASCSGDCSNMRWATTVPITPPMICTDANVAALAGRMSRRTAKARVTAGLRCAPDTGPSTVIKTTRIAPVAIVFPRRATAESSARVSAMMPEPTTVATRTPVPTASAAC